MQSLVYDFVGLPRAALLWLGVTPYSGRPQVVRMNTRGVQEYKIRQLPTLLDEGLIGWRNAHAVLVVPWDLSFLEIASTLKLKSNRSIILLVGMGNRIFKENIGGSVRNSVLRSCSFQERETIDHKPFHLVIDCLGMSNELEEEISIVIGGSGRRVANLKLRQGRSLSDAEIAQSVEEMKIREEAWHGATCSLVIPLTWQEPLVLSVLEEIEYRLGRKVDNMVLAGYRFGFVSFDQLSFNPYSETASLEAYEAIHD